MRELGRHVAFGAAWMVALRISERFLGLLSTLILVRLLAPADFGLVAMATSVIAMVELLSAFSLDVALIGNSSATRHTYDTAWSLNVIAGAVAAVLLLLLAFPAASFYSESRLTPIVATLSAVLCLQSFENIGVVAFRKDLQFHKEFGFLLSKRLTAILVTVPLAFATRSYWALVAGTAAGRLAGLVVSYRVHPFRPRFSLQEWRSLLGFSSWMVLHNFTYFLTHRSADFVVGRMAGAQSLGVFSIAYEISSLPTSELVAPINRAILPGFAKLAADRSALRNGYLKVTAALIALSLPAALGIAATTDLIVATLLGAKWLATAPLIPPLALSGAFLAMGANTLSVYVALGRPKIPALLNTLRVALLLSALIPGTIYAGLRGAAWGIAAANFVMVPITYALLFRDLGVRTATFAAQIWRPLAATGLMYVAVRFFIPPGAELLGWPENAMHLGACVAIGAFVYCAALALLWVVNGRPNGVERTCLDMLNRRRRNATGPA